MGAPNSTLNRRQRREAKAAAKQAQSAATSNQGEDQQVIDETTPPAEASTSGHVTISPPSQKEPAQPVEASVSVADNTTDLVKLQNQLAEANAKLADASKAAQNNAENVTKSNDFAKEAETAKIAAEKKADKHSRTAVRRTWVAIGAVAGWVATVLLGYPAAKSIGKDEGLAQGKQAALDENKAVVESAKKEGIETGKKEAIVTFTGSFEQISKKASDKLVADRVIESGQSPKVKRAFVAEGNSWAEALKQQKAEAQEQSARPR